MLKSAKVESARRHLGMKYMKLCRPAARRLPPWRLGVTRVSSRNENAVVILRAGASLRRD